MAFMYELLDRVRDWVHYDPETEFYQRHFPSLAENAELRFRPMRRGDLRTIAGIEQSAYEFPWEPATFRDCFSVGYSCWVAEKTGNIVSYGIISVGAGESHLLNLCVVPDAQGCGYGKLMLGKLMGVAIGHRAEVMFLEVRPSNETAIELYRRMGFNEIGMRKGYYPARKGREDALVMARSLFD